MERALKNTKLAEVYGLSLKCFFKDKFKYWDDSYVIPFGEFRWFKKYIFDYVKSGCNGDYVCGKLTSCFGHQFLQFIEAIAIANSRILMRNRTAISRKRESYH